MIHSTSISASNIVDTDGQHLFHAPEEALQQGLKYLSTLDGVDLSNVARCHTVQDNLIEWMRSASHVAAQTADQNAVQGWGWAELIDNEHLRVGLLSLNKENAIPIHDHPGSTGLLVILDGHLQLQQFQCPDSSNSSSQRRMVEMERVNKQLLGPGEYTVFSPSQGNLHSLSAYKGPCLILDVLLSPYRDRDRSWYMPLEASNVSEPRFNAVQLKASV